MASGSIGTLVMQRIHVKKIKPAAYNPRKAVKPGDPEWEALARSLDEFGYVDPLVWNQQSGNLVGGHQRLAVLLARGVKMVDVSVVNLDAAREKLLNLALNKVRGAGWDDKKLAGLLEELTAAGGAVDVALSGFGPAEIKAIVEEGDRLMEVLVPREQPGGGKEDGEDGAGAKNAGGKEPSVFNLLVQCGTAAKQKRLFAKLSEEGFVCELRTS